MAHNIAQEVESSNGSWVHAYLHRVEGDLGNAAYWYRRANKPSKSNESLDVEWTEISEAILFPTDYLRLLVQTELSGIKICRYNHR